MAAYFLSASDSLKVWDARTLSIVPSTTSVDLASIVKAIWSPKGDCIALSGFPKQCDFANIYLLSVSCGTIGKPVDIFAPDTKSGNGSRDSSSSKHISRTLMAFSTVGQVIACASKEGVIDIYDRKAKKITKSFSSALMGCEVTAVVFSADDSTLIVADTEGSVWFRGISNGDANSPVRVSGQFKAILVFQPLPGNRHVLVCGHESGAITLLDTFKKEFTSPFQSISTHLAACKDIAFSATHPNIAASVGMDNQIIIYDMGAKKILNKIMCDSSLYSIIFLPSGSEILCGTSTGKILVYNLTKEKSPQKIFLEHNGPVVSLAVPPLQMKPIPNEPNSSGIVRPGYSHTSLKPSIPATESRLTKRTSVPERAEPTSKDILAKTALRPVGKPSADKGSISASTPPIVPQPHRVQQQKEIHLGSGDAVHSTPVNAALSPDITVRDIHVNNPTSPASSNIEPIDNVASVKHLNNGIDTALASQLDTLDKKIDSVTMETRIAALDIQDLILDYGKENLERLSDAEKKIRKLQEDTARNTTVLELILGELTAIRQRMPYL